MKYDTEIKVVPIKRPFENTCMTHELSKVTIVGQYAMDLCRSGMIMGHQDERTKKTRMLPPQQIVQRACAIAEALFAEMDARGWIKEMPPLSELQGDDPSKVGF